MTEIDLTLAGEQITATAERALIWKDTVFVADVHFGKDAMLRSALRWAPPGGTETDLARLDALLIGHSARRLVILGDLFHSEHAAECAPTLRAWKDRHPNCEVLAIPGNHDRRTGQLAADCGFRAEPEGFRLGPWVLRHHPSAEPQAYTLCGHLHPLAGLRGPGRQRLRLPCFLLSERQGILPAFGSFTGGATVRPRPTDRVLAVGKGEIIPLFA